MHKSSKPVTLQRTGPRKTRKPLLKRALNLVEGNALWDLFKSIFNWVLGIAGSASTFSAWARKAPVWEIWGLGCGTVVLLYLLLHRSGKKGKVSAPSKWPWPLIICMSSLILFGIATWRTTPTQRFEIFLKNAFLAKTAQTQTCIWLDVEIKNRGEPSVIDDWKLVVRFPDGSQIPGYQSVIPPVVTNDSRTGPTIPLDTIAATQKVAAIKLHGQLAFFVNDQYSNLVTNNHVKPGIIFELSVKDNDGVWHKTDLRPDTLLDLSN